MDSQMVRNFVNSKIYTSRDITNLIKDIRLLSYFFRNIGIDYCNRLINRVADMMAERAH